MSRALEFLDVGRAELQALRERVGAQQLELFAEQAQGVSVHVQGAGHAVVEVAGQGAGMAGAGGRGLLECQLAHVAVAEDLLGALLADVFVEHALANQQAQLTGNPQRPLI